MLNIEAIKQVMGLSRIISIDKRMTRSTNEYQGIDLAV